MTFLMTGDLYRNSRAIKQLRALASRAWIVDVYFLQGHAPEVALPGGIRPHALPRPEGSGPAFFRKVQQLFVKTLGSKEADLFHASDLYALPACHSRADDLEAPYSYDAREYYPHVAGTVGKPWARWWWARVERKHIRDASAVFTVSDSIAHALASDYGIPTPIVVANVPPSATPDGAEGVDLRTLSSDSSRPIILHLGLMKAHRGGETLVQAMEHAPEADLVFLGSGPAQSSLESLSIELGLRDRVHFMDPVPPDAIRATIRTADIGVTLLEGNCLNHRYALPNKLFDYIHAGLPVLASDLDETKRVFDQFSIGCTTQADNPIEVGKTLRDMLNRLPDRPWDEGLRTAAETFVWESASQRFLDRIDAVLPPVTP